MQNKSQLQQKNNKLFFNYKRYFAYLFVLWILTLVFEFDLRDLLRFC